MMPLSRHLISMFLLTSVGAVASAATPPPARRSVEIEWDAIEGASAYEVRVTRKDGTGKPLTFKLKDSRWSANVKPGPYVMELRAFDRRGVPGAWSPPSDIVVKILAPAQLTPAPAQSIAARRAGEEPVTFSWEPVELARGYRLEITGQDFTKTETTKRSSLVVKLPAAADYEWRVTSLDERGEPGEVLEKASPFTVRGPALETPRPAAPLSKYVDHIAWPEVDHAGAYAVELSVYNRQTRAWDPLPGPTQVTRGEYPIDVSRPSGRYRLFVTATAPQRTSSRRASLTFGTHGGFTDPARLRDAQLRDSLYKPSAYYAIASLLPGQTSYTSTLADQNSRVLFESGAVTARLGVGYQSRASAWGGFAIADVGRTAVGTAAFTSQSAEAHVSYALNVGHRGLLHFGAGAFLKQLPLVSGTPMNGFENLGRVNQYGPHLGATYLLPFTERWGLRADARAYYIAAGSAGGGALSPAIAHQFQLLGTYRTSPRWTLIGGVGQRHDEATWAATPGGASYARPGDVNHISMESRILNLSVEFGF